MVSDCFKKLWNRLVVEQWRWLIACSVLSYLQNINCRALQVSFEECAKFKEETLTNVDGRKTYKAPSLGPGGVAALCMGLFLSPVTSGRSADM